MADFKFFAERVRNRSGISENLVFFIQLSRFLSTYVVCGTARTEIRMSFSSEKTVD